MARVSLPSLRNLKARDFSGGPNLRDAASELADNELVDGWNVTFDERGGAGSRLGYVKWNSTAFSAGAVKNMHYSGVLDNVVTQAGASLYLGTTNTIRKTFTTAARAVFVDFNGKVFAGHPVDGLWYSTDGITWTAVADADRPATCAAMAVWQNKLWVVPASSSSIQWSDAGDGTAWTAASVNQLREKDDEPVVALAGSSGIDVVGRPGLLAFKRESFYRIHDSATGAYETLDAKIGAASALAVVSVGGKTITLSEYGISWTDGLSAMRPASDRFEPLWSPAQINHAQLDLICAGFLRNRAYFSLPRAGATANDLSLEYHPDQGWVAPGSNAVACYTTYGLDTEKLYGGSPSVSGQAYELYKGGSDDGVAISSRMQTRWFEPSDGFLTRLRRIRLVGRSGTVALTVAIRKDYASSGGDAYSVTLNDLDSVAYDSGETYDSGEMYGVPAAQVYQDIHSPGTCKSFSLRVSASTTTTGNALQLLGAGDAPEVGAWALYGFDLLYVPLGIA